MTQYNKMVNDFNKTGGIVGKIQNAFVGSNFEQMKKNEKSYSDKIDMSYNSELDNYIKSLGAKQVISDRGSYFELNGALEEVYEKMQSIQEVANQLGEDKYANRLSDQINDAQELTDKYKDMYDAYVLYDQVLKDTDYASAYQKAMSDYQNYQKQATENGLDSEEAKKASEQYAQNMSEAIQKALEMAMMKLLIILRVYILTFNLLSKHGNSKLKSHQNGMMAQRITSTTKRPIKR